PDNGRPSAACAALDGHLSLTNQREPLPRAQAVHRSSVSATFATGDLLRGLHWLSQSRKERYKAAPNIFVAPRPACARGILAVLEADAALHDAAIRKDGGGGEVACAVPACESDNAGDLLRPRHAPERYRCVQFGELGG